MHIGDIVTTSRRILPVTPMPFRSRTSICVLTAAMLSVVSAIAAAQWKGIINIDAHATNGQTYGSEVAVGVDTNATANFDAGIDVLPPIYPPPPSLGHVQVSGDGTDLAENYNDPDSLTFNGELFYDGITSTSTVFRARDLPPNVGWVLLTFGGGSYSGIFNVTNGAAIDITGADAYRLTAAPKFSNMSMQANPTNAAMTDYNLQLQFDAGDAFPHMDVYMSTNLLSQGFTNYAGRLDFVTNKLYQGTISAAKEDPAFFQARTPDL